MSPGEVQPPAAGGPERELHGALGEALRGGIVLPPRGDRQHVAEAAAVLALPRENKFVHRAATRAQLLHLRHHRNHAGHCEILVGCQCLIYMRRIIHFWRE